MIIKHVDNISKQNRLMEEIGMEQIENEIKILARDEYGEELRKIERQNIQLQQENTKVKQENQEYKQENQQYKKENQEYKQGIEKLNEIPNLNPEAKKIINSLNVMR